MKAKVNKVTIQIVKGDIYAMTLDALVHVTDPNLSIHPALAAKAGPSVEKQCEQIGWCDVGSAVLTDAGNLIGVKKICHAVAPRWGEGSERGKLGNVTWKCLSLAEEFELHSIVMPAISAGPLGYPVENCALTMLSKIIDFTFENLKHVRTIVLCLDDDVTFEIFCMEFQRQLEDLKENGEGKVRV